MHHDLRERDLHARLVEGDLDLAVHDTRGGKDILLRDARTDLEDNAGSRLTDQEAIQAVCEICACKNVQEIGGWPENRKNEAIRVGLAAGISIRQLSRLTGIGKNIIERATKS